MYSQKHPEGIKVKDKKETVELSYHKVGTETIKEGVKEKEYDR